MQSTTKKNSFRLPPFHPSAKSRIDPYADPLAADAPGSAD